ncbi:MAG: sulfotransferase family protein [Anaerolineae bacterium]
MRQTARSAIVQWRLLSREASRRSLPDYVIIGAQKAGTTSLQKALARHPDVCTSLVKEVHYFDLHYDQGERWYRAHFCRDVSQARAEKPGHPVVTGEATPFYLAHPMAAERAAHTIPDARLIVLLRDPVERAYSQYAHEVRLGHEHATVHNAFARELALGADDERIGPLGIDAWTLSHRSYLYRGLYAKQLAAWFARFDADQFLILRSEDYFAEPVETLDQVCAFLGVRKVSDLQRPEAFDVHHNRGEPRAPLPLALRKQLEAYFAGPNRALEDLLGRKMGW